MSVETMSREDRLAYFREWNRKSRERQRIAAAAKASYSAAVLAAWLKFSNVCAANRRVMESLS